MEPEESREIVSKLLNKTRNQLGHDNFLGRYWQHVQDQVPDDAIDRRQYQLAIIDRDKPMLAGAERYVRLSVSGMRSNACGRSDHPDNTHPSFLFYGRARGTHRDAAATGESAPDIVPRSHVSIERKSTEVHVTIDDKLFIKGWARGEG